MDATLFDQRRQRSSAASAAQSVARFVTVPKNPIGFSEISEKVGDREAAEAAEHAEAADEQQFVCRGDDKDDGGLAHDFTLFDQRRQPISGISGPQVLAFAPVVAGLLGFSFKRGDTHDDRRMRG